MNTNLDMLALAKSRLGENYIHVVVPKNNPNWHNAWDCAEFTSWLAYQMTETLYGCVNNHNHPASADAYSGAWERDAKEQVLIPSTLEEAFTTAGVFLVRKPPLSGKMGHVAMSDGQGGTVEAAGKQSGVMHGKVEGRLWHYYAKLPALIYLAGQPGTVNSALPLLLQLTNPLTTSPLVGQVQQALKHAGFDPGPVDNTYGPMTIAAVAAFQEANNLVSDGIIGPLTLQKLGLN
ncbi:hypothetical protein CYR55_17840 [Chimaeribacter californicus]|uniref:Peptidoglycan binding-like domain-containing protein n=1 Tax=Chimaeribacter californicus TaxID=2060067 RepID=A0A2N5DZA1_9GAMM|nr:peptidoglycan-binding domain-containing protein [Chimaeribacter californicus]PLR33067.1 hypothetical protein CYR55_17840 [Chimaeribacter californicus]